MTPEERVANLERNLAELYGVVAEQNSIMLMMALRIAGLLARECMADDPMADPATADAVVH